jgi:Sulfotransferase family
MPPSLQIDFIGIGAPKCGSTWVFYALGQHPDICLSEPKETRYFSREDFRPEYTHANAWRPLINSDHADDLTWYARHYRHCPPKALKGEFSPDYIYDEEACSRIHHHFPSVKLLVCLRNPADRAYSMYWARTQYARKNRFETFEQAIEREPRYLLKGQYHKYLKGYLEYFRRNQIKVMLFEDIVNFPEQTIRDLFAFLGLDLGIELDLNRVPKNSAKRSRFVSPAPVMNWLSAWLVERDHAVFLRKIRNLRLKKMLVSISTVECPPGPMSERTRERLRGVFRESIDELEIFLDRDLTAWK